MPSAPIADLTQRAQTLTSAGDLVGAQRVLASALDPADAADPQQADAELAVAAALHARILIALGDPHGARQWAAYAHEAEERLHGPHDDRTMSAAATHAAVLQRVGHYGKAAQVYQELVEELTAREGADSPRVLAAEADLATAEHAAGQCQQARRRLTDAWSRHRELHGDAAPAGIKMLARLGAMERECARDAESREHLALAQELCARYLPADHPLVRQVASLAAGSSTGRHVCGRVEQSSGPQDPPTIRQVPFPRRPSVPDPGGEGFPPDHDPLRPPPDNRPTDPNGTVYQQPLYLADVHQAPEDLAGRHERADTPPPLPGHRAPDYGPDGRRQPIGSAPASTLETPPNSERLLPVRTERPVTERRRQPFLLVAVLIAGIAVAIAIVALTLPDANSAVSPQPTTAAPAATLPSAVTTTTASGGPATAAPVGDPGAPTGVKLTDNRDSVALTWSYPKNAEGPVLVSGGRAGQPVRAFQQLPAGTSDYMVYGLNPTQNYCFTVAVAYATDRIAASAPVCTSR
ncbi:fibronectin type III domain-containing protein [Actinoplanes sp. NPDC026619]|uniref:fibronectin type III domain-containing protein n=1 Tax=Actinoplanes sp. NPDC026619 TaxID=3155798 RepID=UPI0033FC4DB1